MSHPDLRHVRSALPTKLRDVEPLCGILSDLNAFIEEETKTAFLVAQIAHNENAQRVNNSSTWLHSVFRIPSNNYLVAWRFCLSLFRFLHCADNKLKGPFVVKIRMNYSLLLF